MAVSPVAAKLCSFGLVVAAVFVAAYGVGQAVGPVGDAPEAVPAGRVEPAPGHGHDAGNADTGNADTGNADGGGTGNSDGGGDGGGGDAATGGDGGGGHGHDGAGDGHGGSGDGHGGSTGGGAVPAGLQVSVDGHTLDVVDPRGFAFRILDDQGSPVTDFARTHEEFMHLIVVRRDLSGYRHVHPEMSPDGTWRTPLDLAPAGEYRVFADFLPAGRGEGITLGADVAVPGAYRPVPLPPPVATAEVDGYTVTLSGHLDARTTSRLSFRVARGGVPVTELQPYLGAYGHLVALRQGDLAYLHVHPAAGAGPEVGFDAEVPSVGTYRLYLDFKHGDVVRTAEFTTVAESHEE